MINDIRPQKNELREKAKAWRSGLHKGEKQRMDFKIQEKVLNLWKFRDVNTVLLYYAKPNEVDTELLIKRSWSLGKTVALPRCVPGTRDMEFYVVTSLSQLEDGAFGVREPRPEKCEKLRDYSNALCVVPALVYDRQGYRLGYGKGYYDRFLSGFNGSCVGIVYSACVEDEIPHGRFDRNVDAVITEKDNFFCKQE